MDISNPDSFLLVLLELFLRLYRRLLLEFLIVPESAIILLDILLFPLDILLRFLDLFLLLLPSYLLRRL